MMVGITGKSVSLSSFVILVWPDLFSFVL